MKNMKIPVHGIVISLLVLTVIGVAAAILLVGYDYYATPLENRPFHSLNQSFKASGLVGHGLGIIGSLLIVIGVFTYMIRKRVRYFTRVGILKYWLEFHIFLCTLGPLLILFHTTFKFGGIVAVSFWSMVAVFLSGIVGRYIYLQIPRSIEGNELSLLELAEQQEEMTRQLRKSVTLDEKLYELVNQNSSGNSRSKGFLRQHLEERQAVQYLKKELRLQKIPSARSDEIIRQFKAQLKLKRRIERLVTMQKLFAYWHVAHLPFALIMLVVMIIHLVVALTFGYKWIF